jgi:hypothetical protein
LVPRIRGTYLLHQLRLLLGNESFSKVMNSVHTEFREKPLDTAAFVAKAEAVAGRRLRPFIMQWLERDDIPAPIVKADAGRNGDAWTVRVEVTQNGAPYDFLTSVGIQTEKGVEWRLAHIDSANLQKAFEVKSPPQRVVFNIGNDIPVNRESFNTLTNLFDDFRDLLVVYGTSRQIEAQHTLALRYGTLIADTFIESIPAVRQDSEVAEADLKEGHAVVLSVGQDNSLVKELAARLGITIGKNYFEWNGRTYGDADDGLIAAFPNPWNPRRVVFLYLANSSLELFQMTKAHQTLPSWAVFKGDQVTEKGYHPVRALEVGLAGVAGRNEQEGRRSHDE